MDSINKKAEEIVGKRTTGGQPLDIPSELGYTCPVCKNKQMANQVYDERLHWSEYNCFLWCRVCNKDYPSCLCKANIDDAIEIFLLSVKDLIKGSKNE